MFPDYWFSRKVANKKRFFNGLIYISLKKKRKISFTRHDRPINISRHATPKATPSQTSTVLYTLSILVHRYHRRAVDNFGARRKIRRINKVYSPEGSSLAKLPSLKRFPSVGEKGTAEANRGWSSSGSGNVQLGTKREARWGGATEGAVGKRHKKGLSGVSTRESRDCSRINTRSVRVHGGVRFRRRPFTYPRGATENENRSSASANVCQIY